MTAPPSSTQPTLQSTKKGGFLAERLRTKGWSIRDAAQYLGVSRQRLYTVFEDPGRARLWECAIAGMPQCSPQIKEELRTARAAKLKLKPVREVVVERPEFEIGDEVVAIRSSGLAEEDARTSCDCVAAKKRMISSCWCTAPLQRTGSLRRASAITSRPRV